MTQKICIRPIVKVIGNTEYYVESVFNEDAKLNLTDKIKKLMDMDIESRTDPLLHGESKLTSHTPTEVRLQREPGGKGL